VRVWAGQKQKQQVFERFMELPQGDHIQAEYICKKRFFPYHHLICR